MSIITFNPVTYNNLSFTNFSVSETDAGVVTPFTTSSPQLVELNTNTGTTLQWGAFNAGAYYGNASSVLNFNYTVTDTSSSSLIDSVGQLYAADLLSGPGVSLVAVENVFNTSGVLIGTETFVGGQLNFSSIQLTQAVQTVNVQITVTMSVDSTGTNASAVGISEIQQSFGTVATAQTASIGDIAFADINATGVESGFDAGPGVAGVTVELLNATGTTILATTTTGAGGLYSFNGLAAGVYEVAFVAPTGFGFSTQGVGSNAAINSSANQTTGITGPITLTAGEADHNVEVGLVPGGSAAGGTATIGNTVWLDTNRNGLDDGTEKGVAGVTVELLNATGTSVIATTTTNASGNYQFTNLAAATYEVQFLAPTGDSFTTQNVNPGATGDLNSVVNGTGLTAPITITTGEVDNNVNAGLMVPPAALGSTVWLDANRDGLDNNGEAGVAGVTVELLNAAGTSILATTTTNSSGTYAFTGLAAGAYEVKFVAPTGDAFTTENVPITGAATTNSSANSAGVTAAVTLTAGQVDNNVNAGLTIPPAALGSTVWLDANRDGLDDNSEKGVAGVTVELLNAAGTSILATTTTNSSGTYAFTGLNPGAYEVKFLAPTGDVFTTQGVGTNPAVNSSANATTGVTSAVTLTAGQTNNNVDAGLETPPASLGDYVWLDLNRNGLQDSSEPSVAGVTVDLLNATGTSILATTTTNSAGLYNFSNLNAGVYEVKFIAPTGDSFTVQGTNKTSNLDSNPNQTTGVTAPITLTAGQANNTIDAGLVKTSGLTVLKLPGSMVVNQCGQVTYTFDVTNTGSTALTNIKITDNIGSAANPDIITPTLVTTGTYGTLAAGQTWVYTETVNQINCTSSSSGSVCHATTGSNLSAGCTAWLHSSFNPTSCADGATYKFQGVSCTISTGGAGSKSITVGCPDSEVTFSKYCNQATTVYNSSTDCWVTTLPANCNPGSVFLSGCPVTIPSGYNLTNGNATWSIGDSSNNCGASNLTWDGGCTGYQNFSQNSLNGTTDYNQIGVKSCDNLSGYGGGGDCNSGYGWNGSSYCNTGYNSYGNSGYGYGNNSYGNGYGNNGYGNNGWQGSGSDNCGTPENQYWGSNCGDSNSCGSYGNNYGYGSNCGSGGSSGNGSCGGSGTVASNAMNIAGAADTVTVSASAGTSTITASDTKEVQLLGYNSNISVNGTATTASLSAVYGKAQTLEFTYTPGNTVSLKQVQAGLGTVTGTNSSTMAFIEISNNANPFASGASIYFEGSVTSGEKIYADATTNVLTNMPIAGGHFSTTAGADIFAYVFTNQAAFQGGAAPIQTMAYNTSGSQAMHIGDTIGSLSVIGFVGATGGHLAS